MKSISQSQPQIPHAPAPQLRSEVAPSRDMIRMMQKLEDRVDLMNEKIDLILREIRNVYSIMKK